MYCSSCGKENADGAAFCSSCGKALNASSTSTNSPDIFGKIERATVNAPVSTKSKLNIYGLIASIVIILSTFLPFISVSFFGTKASKSLIDGDGVFFIIIAAVGILFSILGKNIIVTIAGILSTILFFIENSSMTSSLDSDDTWGELAKSLIQKEFGYYLLAIGSIGLIIAGIVGIVLKQKSN
jgi:hypothetical protein